MPIAPFATAWRSGSWRASANEPEMSFPLPAPLAAAIESHDGRQARTPRSRSAPPAISAALSRRPSLRGRDRLARGCRGLLFRRECPRPSRRCARRLSAARELDAILFAREPPRSLRRPRHRELRRAFALAGNLGGDPRRRQSFLPRRRAFARRGLRRFRDARGGAHPFDPLAAPATSCRAPISW